MLNLGIPFQIVNPSASGGGGGGGGPPTITADTTINVPTDYATITAALAFVRSCVVLNGAQVTINVESLLMPVVTEQVFLDGEDMPYLSLTNDGPVSVDATTFTPSLFPLSIWFLLNNSDFGTLTGTWTKAPGAPAVGAVAFGGSTMLTGNQFTATPCSVQGFTLFDMVAFTSSTITMWGTSHGDLAVQQNSRVYADGPGVINGNMTVAQGSQYISTSGVSVNGTNSGTPFTAEDNSVINFRGGITVTVATLNALARADRGSNIVIDTSATATVDVSGIFGTSLIIANGKSSIAFKNTSLSFPTLAFNGNHVCEARDGSEITIDDCTASIDSAIARSSDGSKITSINCNWSVNFTGPLYNNEHAELYSRDQITLVGGAPNLCNAQGGYTSIAPTGTLIGGPSAGSRFDVSDGAVLSGGFNNTLLDWLGGDSQVTLVPTVNGLILSP